MVQRKMLARSASLIALRVLDASSSAMPATLVRHVLIVTKLPAKREFAT